mmetsp:Transcript_3386/g.6323  ORF Transcript_3386/g.6323 Transcript_3386/m.6323 type:complete len:169 (+) Transcript_3386:1964-2470(+)
MTAAAAAAAAAFNFLLPSAAFLGATGVGAGAFGAHSLKSKLEQQQNGVENWKTAFMYQLIHAVALLALSALSSSSSSSLAGVFVSSGGAGGGGGGGGGMYNYNKNIVQVCARAGKYMMAEVVLFSGSIYCLVLNIGNKKIIGPLTPLGGLFMIAGWVVLGTSGMMRHS